MNGLYQVLSPSQQLKVQIWALIMDRAVSFPGATHLTSQRWFSLVKTVTTWQAAAIVKDALETVETTRLSCVAIVAR